MNYYLGMTRALAVVSVSLACGCRFSPPGPWGLSPQVNIPAFVLDDSHGTVAFAIEAEYTGEAFPEGESVGVGVLVLTRVSLSSGQDGVASIEPTDPAFAGEEGLWETGPLEGSLDADAPQAFIAACKGQGACSLHLRLIYTLATGETAKTLESEITASVGGDREGGEPDGAQVCLLVSRANGDARSPVAEEECEPSGCRAVQPLTLGLLLSSIPLLLRRRR